jgi:hypothetical protein
MSDIIRVARYPFCCRASLTLAADGQRIQYGAVRAIANPLSNLFAGNPLGSANGPGFGWLNITVLKLGAVYDLHKAAEGAALYPGHSAESHATSLTTSIRWRSASSTNATPRRTQSSMSRPHGTRQLRRYRRAPPTAAHAIINPSLAVQDTSIVLGLRRAVTSVPFFDERTVSRSDLAHWAPMQRSWSSIAGRLERDKHPCVNSNSVDPA